jgi:hypothetical protein
VDYGYQAAGGQEFHQAYLSEVVVWSSAFFEFDG